MPQTLDKACCMWLTVLPKFWVAPLAFPWQNIKAFDTQPFKMTVGPRRHTMARDLAYYYAACWEEVDWLLVRRLDAFFVEKTIQKGTAV